MIDDPTTPSPEIVIVRRRAAEDGGHHGGAWKIAYADFVTALMAFFLVMWLINASNEATRSQVASYFNPIKLTDSSTGERGLNDPKDSKNKVKPENGSAQTTATAAEKAAEGKLLEDPVKTLDKIEGYAAGPKEPSTTADNSTSTSASTGGSASSIGDPFDPMSWQSLPEASAKTVEQVPDANPKPAREMPSPNEKSIEPPEYQSKAIPVDLVEARSKVDTKTAPSPDIALSNKLAPAVQTKPTGYIKAPVAVDRTLDAERAKFEHAREIKDEISKQMHLSPDQLPENLNVVPVKDGVLISLTDRNGFGMFKIGSAEPDPELIRLVGIIASVLRTHPGIIIIRGHTDSRPYKNKKYDNWQLSTARAHMAYYMLVRGGLDEQRVRRVEGRADRDPKVSSDPGASENRRIDILLGEES